MKKTLLLGASALIGTGMLFASQTKYELFDRCDGKPTISKWNSAPEKSTRSDEEPYIDFTYAGDVTNSYSLKGINSGYIYLAFQIPVDDQTPYIGSQVTDVVCLSPTSTSDRNLINRAYAFITDDLSVLPENIKVSSLSDVAYAENVLPLKEPFTITGDKPIYVGYRIPYTANTYYMPVDEIMQPANVRTCLVGVAATSRTVPTYSNYSNEIGSLCIAARIKGDNLPENLIKISEISAPAWFPTDSNISYTASVKNSGANVVNKASFTTSISDGPSFDSEYTFDIPLECGETRNIVISDVPNPGTGIFTLTSTVTHVNDVALNPNQSASTQYSCYDGGYTRHVVIEEATGNWCQYCTRGLGMMDYLKETYPDWILIAVHGGSGTWTSEPMAVPGYENWSYKFISGFPQAVANRTSEVMVWFQDEDDEFYKPINDYYTSFPAYCDVDLKVRLSDDRKSVFIGATSVFAFDMDVPHALSFVLVEDNVGPYSQANYYYGKPEAGEWANFPSGTKMKYNEVARAIDNYPGHTDAYPSNIVGGTEYQYAIEMPLTYSYGKDADGKPGTNINPGDFKVVALITNATTGEIVNAKELLVNPASVESVISDGAMVSVALEGNDIVVTGTDDYAVYTLDGRKVSANNVVPGIYIVKAADKSYKILVK